MPWIWRLDLGTWKHSPQGARGRQWLAGLEGRTRTTQYYRVSSRGSEVANATSCVHEALGGQHLIIISSAGCTSPTCCETLQSSLSTPASSVDTSNSAGLRTTWSGAGCPRNRVRVVLHFRSKTFGRAFCLELVLVLYHILVQRSTLLRAPEERAACPGSEERHVYTSQVYLVAGRCVEGTKSVGPQVTTFLPSFHTLILMPCTTLARTPSSHTVIPSHRHIVTP